MAKLMAKGAPSPDPVSALLRSDLVAFASRCLREIQGGEELACSWHIELIAAELEAVARGERRRLMINLPPRHLKSLIASVALPAWLLGRNPGARVICVSYAQDLADKFGRECRQIMEAAWYRRAFPQTSLTRAKKAVSEFETTKGGGRLGTSVGGVLTGRGADFIIVDDPMKASDAFSEVVRTNVNNWYATTLLSRLNDKRSGAIVIVMQRLHEEDLCGTLLAKGGDWRQIRLAAIATEDERFCIVRRTGQRMVGRKAGEALHAAREPLAILEAMRADTGEQVFSAQYQQDPLPAEGSIVKTKWLTYYSPEEEPERWDTCFQSWDTANKLTDGSDFSVCTTWGVSCRKLYLLHVLRDRLTFPALCEKVVAHQAHWNAKTVLIEDKASGTQLIQQLASWRHYWVRRIEPFGDKVMRMHGQTVQFENGGVLLPKDAPWLRDYIRELTSFPNAKHDDQVDSTSQALDFFNPRQVEPGILTYMRDRLERSRLAAAA